MRAEDYTVRDLELAGWPVRITTYRIASAWHARADNVSPGATIARATSADRKRALRRVTEKATRRLAQTRRRP